MLSGGFPDTISCYTKDFVMQLLCVLVYLAGTEKAAEIYKIHAPDCLA